MLFINRGLVMHIETMVNCLDLFEYCLELLMGLFNGEYAEKFPDAQERKKALCPEAFQGYKAKTMEQAIEANLNIIKGIIMLARDSAVWDYHGNSELIREAEKILRA